LHFKVLFKLKIMPHNNQHLEDIKEIRSIMERSSQFLSLSGLSGIFAGIMALLGAGFVYWYKVTNDPVSYRAQGEYFVEMLLVGSEYAAFQRVIIFTAAIVLVLALAFVILFSARNARRKGLPMWNSAARRLVINLFIPIVTGGLFCIILVYHNLMILVAPTMLIFYGLGLINASKYTLRDVRYLGISEVVLGLISAIWVGYGLLFWAIGFGLLHIVYGFVMFWKYEARSSEKQ
jgi:hypothetical protein